MIQLLRAYCCDCLTGLGPRIINCSELEELCVSSGREEWHMPLIFAPLFPKPVVKSEYVEWMID